MEPSLGPDALEDIARRLARANRDTAARYPGETGRRQPIHTVYGGAHLFRADTARRLGDHALRALEEYAPDPDTLAAATGLAPALAGRVYPRVLEKLRREPVEDFRLDFEDGYGRRADAEEDGHAISAAAQVASGLESGGLPPYLGIRIKPLSEELRGRALRTLDLFLTALAGRTAGRLPANFVVTLPKITSPDQVAASADVLDRLESALGLPPGAVRLEVMIETPQAILGPHGECHVLPLVDAGRGRCVAAHFGTYDYTAACGITAAHQHMTHPACDHARQAMQVALAGTGIWLSDGATNILPVPRHRSEPGGPPLTPLQIEANRAAVHRAWRLHVEHINHSLIGGFYQGWDLHPAQLPTRYAAVYAFFLEHLDAAAERLRNFLDQAARATLAGDVFDDAATGQGLLNYFLRALNCGAIAEEDAVRLTGTTRAELETGSFVRILQGRKILD